MSEDYTDSLNRVIDGLESIERSINLPKVSVRYHPSKVSISVDMGDAAVTIRLTPEQMRELVSQYCVEHGLYTARMPSAHSDVPL